jgi:hypothetical protein
LIKLKTILTRNGNFLIGFLKECPKSQICSQTMAVVADDLFSAAKETNTLM